MNYEELHQLIRDLPASPSASERQVRWLDEGSHLGVSRDPQNRVELFISGPVLLCTTSIVAANLAHDRWVRVNDDDLEANRVVLPNEPYFDAVAAFLCAHLLENGVSRDRQQAFSQSERVIALALERSRLQGESLTGLLGELYLMRALMSAAPSRCREIIESWYGYGRSSRDFQLGAVGVEVKATTSATSRHRIQGIHQVEVGHSVTGALETELLLVSVGIERVEASDAHAGTWTLPSLVRSLLDRVSSEVGEGHDGETLCALLLSRIREYGVGLGFGYDHSEPHHQLLFGQSWQTAFVRGYRMTDPAVTVMRSGDLLEFPMVDANTVEFTVDLPEQITGDLNPIAGTAAVAGFLVTAAWS